MPALPAATTRKAEKLYIVPQKTQLAALCWRESDKGTREILLVTSSTGRWILPKGWPMRDKSDGKAALTEAWEEAGVAKGKVRRKPLGQFMSCKLVSTGDEIPCVTRVYSVRVDKLADEWPEMDKRNRRWVSVEEAAAIVSEDGLRQMLYAF